MRAIDCITACVSLKSKSSPVRPAAENTVQLDPWLQPCRKPRESGLTVLIMETVDW